MRFFCSLALIATAVLYSNAQTPRPVPDDPKAILESVETSSAPTIDGVIGPNEWPSEAHRQGFSDKDTNLPSDDLGEFWLTYDENFIYFAGRVKTDPSKVIDDEFRPNTSLKGNDNFSLLIDPSGEYSNSNVFATNAAGATSIELSGGRAAKTEWLGEIEANGHKTKTGWECEMRIPWSIMSMPPAGKRTMRFNVYWYRSIKSNTYVYRYTNGQADRDPRWTGVQSPKVSSSRTLNLLPFFTGSVQDGREPGLNAGLDLKTSLTDTVQVVGTVSPDFRNIESSILSLDFSRFERLAKENRPFFEEGSDYIRTGYDNKLFASQRIRRLDTGLNIYGTLNSKTQFGLLTTVDFGDQQATVMSGKYQMSEGSSIQAAYVRNDQPGLNSNAGMINIGTRSGDTTYFFNNQVTDDEVEKTGIRSTAGFSYEKSGVNAGMDYVAVTPGFFPRLGFAPERDFRGVEGYTYWDLTPVSGALNSVSYGLDWRTFTRTDGGFYRDSINGSFEGSLRNGIGFSLNGSMSKFEGSHDHLYSVGIGYPVADPYRKAVLSYGEGQFDGEDYRTIGLELAYRPAKRVQVNLSSQFVDYKGFQRQHILSSRYDLNKFETVGGRLVEEGDHVNWYLSFSHSGGRGNEYFFLIGDPRADSFANRFAFKVTVPLTVHY